MAWNTHPYSYSGHLYIHTPTTVVSGRVSTSTAVGSIYRTITLSSIVGTIGDVRPGMTITIGSSAGARDLGMCMALGTYSTNILEIWAARGLLLGEISPNVNAYVTVLDDYRLWFLPPYIIDTTLYRPAASVDVNPYTAAGEKSYVGPPVPVTGAPQVSTGAFNSTTLDFDASDSYAVAPNSIVTGYGAALAGTYSASTTNGANAASRAGDGNVATYWQATTNTGWLEINFGTAKTVKMVYLYGPTGVFSGTPTAATVEYYNGSSWVSVKSGVYENLEAPAYWFIFGDYSAARWRLNVSATYLNGNVTVGEMTMHEAASGYAWAFGDGTPSTSTDASPTDVSFPPGFRWVHLTITDSYRLTGYRHIPVLVTGATGTEAYYDNQTSEMAYTEATYSASSYYNVHGQTFTPNLAFDGDDVAGWYTESGQTTGWLQIEFPTARKLWKYQIQAINYAGLLDATAKNFTFQYWDADTSAFVVADTQTNQTGWTAGEVREYELAAAVTSTKFRLDITANDGNSTYVHVIELNLFESVYVPRDIDTTVYPVIDNFEVVDQRRTSEGQEITFRVFEDIALSSYPAGALVMYWEDERHGATAGSLTGPAGSQNLKFWGWIDEEPTVIETGGLRSVELRCVDVAGRMKRLWAPSIMATRKATPNQGWYNVAGLNMDRWMYYLLQWHSNVLMLADFTWSGLGDTWAYPILEANAGSLWDQMAGQALKFDHRLTCDRFGRLWVKADPQLLASASRTSTVQVALTADDVSSIKYTITDTPRAHWVWADALATSTKDYDDGTWTPAAFYAVAPSAAPGQGVAENTVGQRLATSQAYLNAVIGHLYFVRLNAPNSQFDIQLAHAGDAGIEPADMTWVTLTLPAAYAAQRGLTFTTTRFLPLEVRVQHMSGTGTKQISIVVEREFVGVAGTTYTP